MKVTASIRVPNGKVTKAIPRRKVTMPHMRTIHHGNTGISGEKHAEGTSVSDMGDPCQYSTILAIAFAAGMPLSSSGDSFVTACHRREKFAGTRSPGL
jgi:hypothetical protein